MKRPEQEMHRTVVQHLHMRGAAGLVFFHPANGGFRSPVEASIMKGLGVRAGVADLILLHRGTFHALELKSLNGKATTAQAVFLEDVTAAGGKTAICDTLDDALEALEGWGLLQGRMQ
jgi:hypothetical protein